jgi:large subunit ribosomal protein L21
LADAFFMNLQVKYNGYKGKKMFAVIKTGGKQYRVQVGDILDVEILDLEEGKKVVFGDVLLIEDDKNTLIGTPVIEKAQVVGEVVKNFKDKKVLVFKKKRRKQYRKLTGHRQQLTRIKIEKIVSSVEAPDKIKPSEKKPKPEEELRKLEAEIAKKKPVAKVEEQKKAEPKASPEQAKPEKVEKKKVKAREKRPKPTKAVAPKKKTATKKPGVKKATTKAKKTSPKKEK